jgi:hypothetical protein
MKISFNWNIKDKSKPFGFFMEECLSKDEADKIKKLDLEKILLMDSEERLSIFSGLLGKEKADWFNARFEKDLVLKNQKAGMMNWINNDKEIKPKWRKEIIRKISELEKPLYKEKLDNFMEELADLKLGVGITLEEAQMITDLCKKANDAKVKMDNGGSKTDYEIAHKNLEDYVEMLKKGAD